MGDDRPRVGISACLLGERVRYDGRLKASREIQDLLGLHVHFVPVCPEVGCGLSVPREPINLQGDPRAPQVITATSRLDLTARLEEWSRQRIQELAQKDLHGFILKCRSPSCGVKGVMLHDGEGGCRPEGQGVFARLLMERLPHLLVREDEQLQTAAHIEAYLCRLKEQLKPHHLEGK